MVCLGGAFGALLRYCSNNLALKFFSNAIFSTFFLNITGSFLMGYIYFSSINKFPNMPDVLKIFLTVGFLGALTTFSTFSIELFNLLKEEKILYFFVYLLLSVIIGVLAVYLGYLLSKLG